MFKSVLGEDWTQVTYEMIGFLRREGQLGGPRQISELVLSRFYKRLIYLVVAMPLPSLKRLHVDLESRGTGFGHINWFEDYSCVFEGWDDAAAIWRSLKKVEVCITVTLNIKEYGVSGWRDPQPGVWNIWVSRMCYSSRPCR